MTYDNDGMHSATCSMSIALTVIILATTTSQSTHGMEGDIVAARHVLQAWDSREQHVRSFDIKWEGIEFRSSQCTLDHQLFGNIMEEPPVKEDASFEMNGRFLISADGRLRHEYHEKAWCPERERYMPRGEIGTFDGETRTKYYPVSITADFPSVHISQRDAGAVGRDLRLLPVRLVYRPFDDANTPRHAAGLNKGAAHIQLVVFRRQRKDRYSPPESKPCRYTYSHDHAGTRGSERRTAAIHPVLQQPPALLPGTPARQITCGIGNDARFGLCATSRGSAADLGSSAGASPGSDRSSSSVPRSWQRCSAR
jgi:hypothetical protein